ncbi:YsnF/AvaK domain-containing protein [Arthrobacter sp. NPDC056691]|uniref:YsnF/AvaK domain-containing protein n=1 Tax=Arthrobacter sp. NPDC056691 TaxID=3345913 RepID=UPI0036718831
MLAKEHIDDLLSRSGNILSTDGHKIGSIGQIYADDDSGQPTWATARTGLFGTSESFVPLEGSRVEGDDLVVPYTKDQVKDAPRVDTDGHLEPSEEDRLYEHYQFNGGRSYTDTGRDFDDTATTGAGYDTDASGAVGHDTSGPTTDDAMTRSEERLNVGTERQATGRARLRKYVTTENVTQTVPVRREEVRIEREPITDANRAAAMSGPDLSDEEHEVTLHEERPVVDKETVPVERVRLETDTVTDEVTVDEEVRKERIETDGDTRR